MSCSLVLVKNIRKVIKFMAVFRSGPCINSLDELTDSSIYKHQAEDDEVRPTRAARQRVDGWHRDGRGRDGDERRGVPAAVTLFRWT